MKTVKDIMTTPVISAQMDETFITVSKRMLENKIGGVPVVDDDNKLVGFLSETDFCASTNPAYNVPQLFGRFVDAGHIDDVYKEIAEVKVKELMVKPVVSIPQDTKLDKLVATMMKHGYKRFPVVNEDDEVVGIISRLDLMKLLILLPS